MEGDMEGDREEGREARRWRGRQGKKWKEMERIKISSHPRD